MATRAQLYQRYILIGMVLAILVGGTVGLSFHEKDAKEQAEVRLLGVNLEGLGSGFVAVLKFIVLPLVITSMVVGVTSLGSTAGLGRLGAKTVAYYFLTTAIAVSLGLVVVNIINPGKFITREERKVYPSKGTEDIVKTFLPWNVIQQTKGSSRVNILAVIIDSILTGWVLLMLGKRSRWVIRIFQVCNKFILKITALLMLLAPLGIFGIVASKVGEKGLEAITELAPYFFTVLAGLALHAFIVLPLILKYLGRREVLPYARDVAPALSMAFATASSSATLPVTMECVEENAKVDKKTANFVLPLGATVNMDGTALYEAVAVMTIAQSLGMDITLAEQITIFLTATLAAVGAAGIPEAGLVTMVIVLRAVDIPPVYIGTIFAIDWFLDRFRTTVNVWGDTVGAAVIARMTRKSGPPASAPAQQDA